MPIYLFAMLLIIFIPIFMLSVILSNEDITLKIIVCFLSVLSLPVVICILYRIVLEHFFLKNFEHTKDLEDLAYDLFDAHPNTVFLRPHKSEFEKVIEAQESILPANTIENASLKTSRFLMLQRISLACIVVSISIMGLTALIYE